MPENHKHIFLSGNVKSENYKAASKPNSGPNIPIRDRVSHSARLLEKFDEIWKQNSLLQQERAAEQISTKEGTYISFTSPIDQDLITKSLENFKYGIRLITSNGEINEFPYKKSMTQTKPLWMLDHRGTGYYIPEVPKGAELKLQHVNQTNPQFQDKGEVSRDFSTVLFDHGVTPENATYEYAVVFNTDKAKMESFAADMKGKKKPYFVLQQTEKAHVVASPKNATTAYAIYDESAEIRKGLVKSVNRPSTFVVKKDHEGIKLAVSDPDLNIYDGQDDLLPDGTRTEVSVYEHEWFYWPSRSSKVQITLKGEWEIAKQIKEMETAQNKKAKVVSDIGETVLEFECRDGLSAEVMLTKAK